MPEPYRARIEDVKAYSLPGRMVREILSGRISEAAGVGLRLVELYPVDPGSPRSPHVHRTMEEVIVVVEGAGATWVEGKWYRLAAGDVIQVPAGARHGTVNPGPGVLKLLCFFPSAAPEKDIVELPDLLLSGWETAE